MQLSAQEEYGLRCLLHVARHAQESLASITEISRAEGLSPEYTAKLMRVLRQSGLVESVRGAAGGYRLAQPAATVSVWDALNAVGSPLFSNEFCREHAGQRGDCAHDTDCSLRALWTWIGQAVRSGLEGLTLVDMLASEGSIAQRLEGKAPLIQIRPIPHQEAKV